MPRVKYTDLRRKARIAALQSLFAGDIRGSLEDASLELLAEEDGLPEQSSTFAKQLIDDVAGNFTALDLLIQKYAPVWPVPQLAPVDRNILRIALQEILYTPETPDKTAINEAVELAKVFGSESSSRFVNGVLGSVMADTSTVGPLP